MKNVRFELDAVKNTAVKEAVLSFLSREDSAPVVTHNYIVLPGFCDVHVHLREPGYIYKETVKSGTMAAARGGYTAVCAMPNLNPVPDSMEHLQIQLDAIENDAVIDVYPYGAITVGEDGKQLADLSAMAPYVCGFSDDGRGVTDKALMLEAMKKAKELGRMIVAHCEDKSLIPAGGCIHDGIYAKEHGHKGISSESEYIEIERDIPLVKESGVAYHVCHVSAKQSVEIIRRAKAEGVNITAETGPHYLILCDEDLLEEGRFKMNPPLRGRDDMKALIEGILDGTLDMIATDHAPHSAEEKSKGLSGSMFGIVGLETAFPILYTELVKKDIITLEKLSALMSDVPRARFGIEGDAGFTVFEINTPYKIDEGEFLSAGKSTPFSGREVYGRCVLTVHNENIVYTDNSII